MVIFKKRVPGLSEKALARFVARARKAARLSGAVNILVTSNRELQSLNRRFREKDKATDVLSFPAMQGPEAGFAGDVAISAEIAARNARRLGHAASEEVRILVLHGVLHLAGFDHERDDGEMAQVEARLRKSLRLPVGLIERNGQMETGHQKRLTRRTRRKALASGYRPGRAKARVPARASR